MTPFELTLNNLAVGLAVSTACALVGTYLVLRRMALLGDAISHAVLPGLVVGFMLSGTRDLAPMLVGAVLAGLLTAVLTETLWRTARVDPDAGMGVIFTSLFALGVILLSRFHSQVDLDPGCVLYGQLEYSGFDRRAWWGLLVPRQLPGLLAIVGVNLIFIALFWKELKLTSFDPALATTLGISAGLVHHLLLALVACSTVASFESVGSILVIAMLIVPGATAHLLTDRLAPLLVVAVVCGWTATVGGYLAAIALDTEAAGMIASASGVQFGLVVLLAPRHGLVGQWLRRLRLALQIAREDTLARLYRAAESDEVVAGEVVAGEVVEGQAQPAGASRAPAVGGRLRRGTALALLRIQGLVRSGPGGLELTPDGARRAATVVRSHRLWETYLNEHLPLPLDHLHEPAHRMEHFLSEELAARIRQSLPERRTDPHGRPIP